jgi:hypothetical protein
MFITRLKLTLFLFLFSTSGVFAQVDYIEPKCEFTGVQATDKLHKDFSDIRFWVTMEAMIQGMPWKGSPFPDIKTCRVSAFTGVLTLIDFNDNYLYFNVENRIIASSPSGSAQHAYCYDTFKKQSFRPIQGRCFTLPR